MGEVVNDKKVAVLKMSNIESNLFTKDCIRTALLSLMGVKIFEKITVTDIINRAGVSRGGFYRNYQSKLDVLQEICDELLRYILDFMTEHKLYENTREWFVDFFYNVANSQEKYQLLVNAKVPQNVVIEFDEGRILKKLQRNESPLEQYRAVAIAKGLTEIVIVWVRNGMKESPEEMADMMLNIYMINN